VNDTVTVDGAVPDLDESLSQLLLVAVQVSVPEPRLEIFSTWLGGRVFLVAYQMKERRVGLTPIVFTAVVRGCDTETGSACGADAGPVGVSEQEADATVLASASRVWLKKRRLDMVPPRRAGCTAHPYNC
jgi:hypothetical protein